MLTIRKLIIRQFAFDPYMHEEISFVNQARATHTAFKNLAS